jgi:hypothetical protein
MDMAMSGAGGGDKRELLARHGLEGATWLETVDHYMYDDPALYRALLSDPLALHGRIKSWDLAFYTGARGDYARGRGWTWWMAVRELIQNALDASEEMYGRAKMYIDIFSDGHRLHIMNRGPRLPIMAWMFGGSTKQCWQRGQFGEGLKMAAIYYAGIGYPLYIFNMNEVYKAIVSPTSGVVYVVVGTAAQAFEGTDAIVIDPETMANANAIRNTVFTNIFTSIYSSTFSEVTWNPSECQHPEPSFAFDMSDVLYVRDIYVNRISNITGHTERPSLLGYNLWWVELDPNRVTVAAERSQKWAQPLDWNIVLTWTPKIVQTLLSRLVVPTGPGMYQVSDKYYESSIWLGSAPVNNEMVEAAGEWLKQHGIEAVAEFGPQVEGLKYLAKVNTLLLMPRGFLPLFPKEMRLDYLYTERHVKNAENAPRMAIPEGSMTLGQRGAVNAVKGYYLYLMHMMFLKRIPAVLLVPPGGLGEGVEGMCDRANYTVMIDASATTDLGNLMGVAAHEFSHCMSATADDVTSEFEANLTKVAGYTNKMYFGHGFEVRLFLDASYNYGGGGKIVDYGYFSDWQDGVMSSISKAMSGPLAAVGLSQYSSVLLDRLLRSLSTDMSFHGLPSYIAVKVHYDPKRDTAPGIADIGESYAPIGSRDMMPSSWESDARSSAARAVSAMNRSKCDLVVVLMYDPLLDEYRLMADTINEYKADVASC